jgi:ATP-dependent exoDNAse (exonuclease V) beta subunit
MNVFKELNKFKGIKYFDEPHKYLIDDQQLTSGTTFIGQFKPKFDAPKMAKSTAKKTGQTVEEVLADWDYKRDFASMKGTLVHNYAENYWQNKIFPFNDKIVSDRFDDEGATNLKERYSACVKMFEDFYKDSCNSLVPIASELVIGDKQLGIGGMVDQLFWNQKHGELQIWDYKTNKQIRMQSDYKKRFSAPINFIEECEFESYSIQLNLYKYIIEKNTNLKIGKLYLVWLFEENETYQVIECKDYQHIIKLMIENQINNNGNNN